MEFKSLKNIESSFRQIRLFSLVFLAACTLLTGFSVWKSYRFAEAQREKVYVLDEGKSLIMALSQDPRGTVRWKPGNTCAACTSCSSRWPPTRRPSSLT